MGGDGLCDVASSRACTRKLAPRAGSMLRSAWNRKQLTLSCGRCWSVAHVLFRCDRRGALAPDSVCLPVSRLSCRSLPNYIFLQLTLTFPPCRPYPAPLRSSGPATPCKYHRRINTNQLQDRDYTIPSLPAELQGVRLTCVQTAQGDKRAGGSRLWRLSLMQVQVFSGQSRGSEAFCPPISSDLEVCIRSRAYPWWHRSKLYRADMDSSLNIDLQHAHWYLSRTR